MDERPSLTVVCPSDDPVLSPGLWKHLKTRRCMNCWTWYAVGPEGACHVLMDDVMRIGPLCPPCGASVLRPRDDR